MTFGVAHWIPMMIVLQLSMQGEEIIEHTNVKCYVFTF